MAFAPSALPVLLLDGGGGMVAAPMAQGPVAGRRTPFGSSKISGAGLPAGQPSSPLVAEGPRILKERALPASESRINNFNESCT